MRVYPSNDGWIGEYGGWYIYPTDTTYYDKVDEHTTPDGQYLWADKDAVLRMNYFLTDLPDYVIEITEVTMYGYMKQTGGTPYLALAYGYGTSLDDVVYDYYNYPGPHDWGLKSHTFSGISYTDDQITNFVIGIGALPGAAGDMLYIEQLYAEITYVMSGTVQGSILELNKKEGEILELNEKDGTIKEVNIKDGTIVETTGFHKASENFSSEAIGATGTSIDFIDVDASSVTEIVKSIGGHKNVLQFNGTNICTHTFSTGNKTTGIREFYLRTTDVTKDFYIYFRDGSDRCVDIRITGSKLKSFDGASFHDICAIINNKWYHIKVQWYADNTFDCYVNRTLEASGFDFRDNQTNGIDDIQFYPTNATVYQYFDAWGNPADSDYDEGDNLTMEIGSKTGSITEINVKSGTIKEINVKGGTIT